MTSVSQLGFLDFEVSDLSRWTVFLTEVLGLAPSGSSSDGALWFRHDRHAMRFVLRQGPRDDLASVGWECEDHRTFEALIGKLRAAGVAVTEVDGEAAASRCAERVARCNDPSGVPTELVVGSTRQVQAPPTPAVPGGFVGDGCGLGHVVLTATDRAASERFYFDLLGMKLSDHIVCDLYGYAVNLTFMHVNQRHHSVALGGPLDKRLHHFMVEVRRIDDLGAVLDRVVGFGLPIINSLGRHPNDQMISFYAMTPSGFQFEVGFEGLLIDDATWVPETYGRISDWGHQPPAVLAPRRKRVKSEDT